MINPILWKARDGQEARVALFCLSPSSQQGHTGKNRRE